MMADVENILDKDAFFVHSNETPKKGNKEHRNVNV